MHFLNTHSPISGATSWTNGQRGILPCYGVDCNCIKIPTPIQPLGELVATAGRQRCRRFQIRVRRSVPQIPSWTCSYTRRAGPRTAEEEGRSTRGACRCTDGALLLGRGVIKPGGSLRLGRGIRWLDDDIRRSGINIRPAVAEGTTHIPVVWGANTGQAVTEGTTHIPMVWGANTGPA